MSAILEKAKAIVAAVVAFGATWVAQKWGFDISAEMQGTIVAAITAVFVYIVPNATPA